MRCIPARVIIEIPVHVLNSHKDKDQVGDELASRDGPLTAIPELVEQALEEHGLVERVRHFVEQLRKRNEVLPVVEEPS